jgi:hypothetical protein
MVGTQQVWENYDMQAIITDKVVIRLNAEKHLYLTHKIISTYFLS